MKLEENIQKIFTVGGGSKNRLWNEIRKKILEVELEVALSVDASLALHY